MNNHGVVVGQIFDATSHAVRGHGFVWDGTMHILPDFGAGASPTGINDNGDIVGISYSADASGNVTGHLASFSLTTCTDLGLTNVTTTNLTNAGDFGYMAFDSATSRTHAFIRNLYTGATHEVATNLVSPTISELNEAGHMIGKAGSIGWYDVGNGAQSMFDVFPLNPPAPYTTGTLTALGDQDQLAGSGGNGSRGTAFAWYFTYNSTSGFNQLPTQVQILDYNSAGDGVGQMPTTFGSSQAIFLHNGVITPLINQMGPSPFVPLSGNIINDLGQVLINNTGNWYFFDPALVTDYVPTFVFSGIGTFLYDGNPHAATATAHAGSSSPLTPACTITYNPGGATPPVNGGTYQVTASYPGDPSRRIAAATSTQTITITKLDTFTTVASATFGYDGAPHTTTASLRSFPTMDTSGATFKFTYTPGGTNAPVNPGLYQVTAQFEGNANFNPSSGSGSITIKNPAPNIAVTGGTFDYDGSPHPATATVTDSLTGQTLNSATITYTPGGSSPPVDAGTYTVTAEFSANGLYPSASGSGTIVINKSSTSVTVYGGTFQADGNPHPAVATVTDGQNASVPGALPFITYTPGGSNAPTTPGTYEVSASYAGDANHMASVGTGTIVITQPLPNVDVPGASFTYDGTAHPATAAVTDSITHLPIPGAVATITYSPGGSTPPVTPGTYQVTATFAGNGTYPSATGYGTIVIENANLVVQAYDATKSLNAPLPALSGLISGVVPGDGITVTFSTAATQSSWIGSYPIVPVLNDPLGRLGYYNVAIGSGALSVVFAGNSGILQPINTDGSSVFKQNSTIPAKFKVYDAHGNSVGTQGTVTSFYIVQTVNGTVSSTVNEAVLSTTPDSEFRFDGSQWIFNINTKNLSANMTYYLRVTLADGSTVDFRFGLR